ncbi:NAD(P)H-dependent oxidoreductase [Hyphomicrobium sp. DMF-1]|jgi:putative NADPH-quinone reductase|uniref:NAD(P)H-dependent oxidoreductase n=1 Tax=Hyphomicrobium sp. DMF-1 TaxID=3019544 RepID=UPI0022EBBE0E|nr:NAD(P)H-dependent oxidoreductase [Hyphomicrobium sp. DMF-1]WBT39735.1 NAD(P)H-dependent oxidoreductase [Hyphomicrobium sp. DMF-1]
MKRAVIIVGHSRAGTFCEAIGEAYRTGAEAAGHHAQIFVTSKLAFDPILRGAYVEVQPREPDLEAAYSALRAADHIVLVFPLWLGTLPAILKGFLERILQPEIIEPAQTGQFVKVLAGKSARVIVTMGMPGWIYRWWFGAHALKMLRRNILEFMGVSPVRSTVIGSVEQIGPAGRAGWLAEMRRLGERLS